MSLYQIHCWEKLNNWPFGCDVHHILQQIKLQFIKLHSIYKQTFTSVNHIISAFDVVGVWSTMWSQNCLSCLHLLHSLPHCSHLLLSTFKMRWGDLYADESKSWKYGFVHLLTLFGPIVKLWLDCSHYKCQINMWNSLNPEPCILHCFRPYHVLSCHCFVSVFVQVHSSASTLQ